MGVGNVFVFWDDLLRSDSDRMVSKSTPETGLWLHRTDIRTQSFAGVDRRWLDLDTGKCFRAESGRVDCPAPLQGCAFRAHQGLSARDSLRAGTDLRRIARALPRPRPHRYRASSCGDCAPQPSYGAPSRFPGSGGTGHVSPTGLTLVSEVANFCR